MASPPRAKESKAVEAAEAPAAAATQPSDDPMDEDTKTTDTATGTPAGETLATGDDSVNADGDAPAANEDGGGADAEAGQNSGKDSEATPEEANGVENKTAVTAEEAQNTEGAVSSNGESRGESGKPKEDEGVEAEVEVYRRDMRWLRSAHGMVAEVRRAGPSRCCLRGLLTYRPMKIRSSNVFLFCAVSAIGHDLLF